VDAKAGAIEFYAKWGFTPFAAIEGESEARPRPTMWLPMRAIVERLVEGERGGCAWLGRRELDLLHPARVAPRAALLGVLFNLLIAR
jgi:hypothetical protein